jgi:pimeloyl-ACP methyl ester carboxylesterase
MKKANPPLYNQTYVNTGHGPTVILLHGLFGNFGMWQKTVEVLTENFHVVVPRLPIFDLPVHNTNVKYLVRVLHEFIEWNNLEDVILVGHAIGGQVALMYTYTHPTTVARLILSGSAGLFENSPFDEVTPAEITDYDFIYEKVNEAFYEPKAELSGFVDEIYATVQNIPKRLTIDSLIKSSKQNSVTFFLNKLDHPTLLIWGLEDKITPPEVAMHFHDFLQNSEIRFIEECGHVPMVEKPELFNRHVLSFLT